MDKQIMNVWKVVSCVIFGETFYCVYRDKPDGTREYAGHLFEDEETAQRFAALKRKWEKKT